jgi:hypothetical protein
LLSVTPKQQLIDPVDLVIGNAGKGIGEPGLRIDAVELRAFDEAVGDRVGFATAFGAYYR